jgi:tRNA (guanine37-N1)-methyltransferase
LSNVIILCGHYKGVDGRVRQTLITEEFSIGDYVLSGGELPALVMVDAIVRLLPGAIGDSESALEDSFQSDLLGPPVYTRPSEFEGLSVPQVLLQGNHKAIKAWREQQAMDRTKERRPDIFNQFNTET